MVCGRLARRRAAENTPAADMRGRSKVCALSVKLRSARRRHAPFRNPWIELKRKSFSENRRLHYCEQHAGVVTALQNRDADGAAQAMLGHIEAIEIALFGRR
jgi:DNA-binding GntR family transcriptional regulator